MLRALSPWRNEKSTDSELADFISSPRSASITSLNLNFLHCKMGFHVADGVVTSPPCRVIADSMGFCIGMGPGLGSVDQLFPRVQKTMLRRGLGPKHHLLLVAHQDQSIWPAEAVREFIFPLTASVTQQPAWSPCTLGVLR